MLRSLAHGYPQIPWARAPESRLGLSAFPPLHFVLCLISLSCTSGPHMTLILVRGFHPHPRSSSLAPRGPHLLACRSAPHALLWASPAYFPSWAPQAPRKRSRASGAPRLPPGGPSAVLFRGRQEPHSLVRCNTFPACRKQSLFHNVRSGRSSILPRTAHQRQMFRWGMCLFLNRGSWDCFL